MTKPSVERPHLHRKWDGPGPRGELYHADALLFLRGIRSKTAGIVFLDPPFNLGKNYDPDNPHNDLKPSEEYGKFITQVIDESIRVLAPGGALYLYHLPIWAMRLGSYIEQRLELRHWIAVTMKNGFARGRRLYPAHYGLLYFTKGTPRHFTRPKKQPDVCRHCGKPVRDYGGYASIIKENGGVNLSDVWDDISPVRHTKYKSRVQNELPSKLTSRIVRISGYPRGVLVDPFAGSGSVIMAAIRAKMKFKACDVVESNCKLISERIDTDGNVRNIA
jgi:site-specific DNA-methyltransferase (adenine-specific)